jgi:hypothetical protein
MQVYDFLRLARVGKGAVLVIWSSLVNRFVQLGIEFLGRPGALGDFIDAKSYRSGSALAVELRIGFQGSLAGWSMAR